MNKKKWIILAATLGALMLAGLILPFCLRDRTEEPPVTVQPTTAPLPHIHNYSEQTNPPSCTESGSTVYSCECGFTYYGNEQPATGHAWSQWEIALEPTEEAEGLRRRSCSVCNAVEESSVAKLPPSHKHSYAEEVTAPTCMTGGHTLFVCACGDSYIGNDTAPLGHSFTQYMSNGDATCTVDGTKTANCDRCEASKTVADVGSASGHQYDEKITNATCTTAGYTDCICNCGDTYRLNEVPATGHCWGSWVTTQEPTEEIEGQRERECDTCHTRETGTIAKLPPSHEHNYAENVTAPTCTAGGHTLFVCDCGDSYISNDTAPLGHRFTQYMSNGDATCTVDGTKTAKCDRCSVTHTVSDTGSAKGHRYTQSVVPAECLSDGYTVYTCACGSTYQDDVVTAVGHDWSQWITILEPTEEAEGLRQRSCTRCTEKQEEPIAKLPPVHKHSYTQTITQPGCTTVGYTTYTCACGDTYRADDVAALGHSFTTYIIDNNATCTMDGTKSAQCDRCNETHTIPNPNTAYGHSFSFWTVIQEATQQVDGIQERTCTVCGAKEVRTYQKQNMTYEEFMDLTAEEQQAYFETFVSIEDYFAWYNAAKQEYEENKDKVDIGGDGNVDIGDIIGGGG